MTRIQRRFYSPNNELAQQLQPTSTDEMKMKRLPILLLSVTLFVFACDKNTSKAVAKPTKSETSKPATPKEVAKTNKGNTLTIPKEGKSFKPPVAKDKIPEGAYYCDMGTVHYARMDKGDGKCPLCKMALVKKGDKAQPSGHDHKHNDHNHKH